MKTYLKIQIPFNIKSILVAGFGPLLLLNTSFGASENEIKRLIKATKNRSIKEKIGIFGKTFLGVKTDHGPLGEGKKGKFDKDPLYRFDLFDCTTFVETILALSMTKDFNDFKNQMNEIRYERGQVSYIKRNHFISLDWIPNNTSNGSIRERTKDLFPNNFEIAKALIDKKSWYMKKPSSDIQGQKGLSRDERGKKLKELKSLGKGFRAKKAQVPYISLIKLFQNPSLIKRIPNNSIISIARPNWNLKKLIGTNMNISHQGLAVRVNGTLYYRHATSEKSKRVIDTTFEKYFKRYLNSPTIKGINILEAL